MGKLTEKQLNIIYLSVGFLVATIFAVLCYMDSNEIEELTKKTDEERNKIKGLKEKERDIEESKKKLYAMRSNFDTFQELLPTEKKILDFYSTMEKFRLEKKIDAWESMKKILEKSQGDALSNPENKPTAVAQTKQPVRPAPGAKSQTGPYLQDRYSMSFVGTFDQLGELLNKVETYERFFSVESIKFSVNKTDTKNPTVTDKKGKIDLVLTTFTFNPTAGTSIEEARLEKLLGDFKADVKLEEQMRRKKEALTKKSSFAWRNPTRNPFDENQVLTTKQAKPGKEAGDATIQPPPALSTNEEAKSKFEEVVNLRNSLHMHFIASNIGELDLDIKKNNYDKTLQSLQLALTDKVDADGKMRAKLIEMQKELQEWKKIIQEFDTKNKIGQIVQASAKDLATMEEKYNEGKKKASIKLLKETVEIHNRVMPLLLQYKTMEAQIPELKQLREKLEILYTKADTQINIINLAEKLEITGIIYLPENPKYSVALINKKAVHKDDILEHGFTVFEIKDGEVILRYKEEPVPIRLKKNSKKTLTAGTAKPKTRPKK